MTEERERDASETQRTAFIFANVVSEIGQRAHKSGLRKKNVNRFKARNLTLAFIRARGMFHKGRGHTAPRSSSR